VAERAVGAARHDLLRGPADPGQPSGEHGVTAEHAAGGADADVVTDAERAAQQNLLVGERRVELGGVHTSRSRRAPGGGRGRGRGQVPRPQRRRVDPVLEPGNPGGPLAQLAGPPRRCQDHGRRPVADRRAVVRAERVGDVGLAEQSLDRYLPGQLRPRVRDRRGAAARRDVGHLGLAPQPGLDPEPGLQRRDTHRVRPQRRQQVRVELQREHPPQLSGR
jgi:hypothetical protein